MIYNNRAIFSFTIKSITLLTPPLNSWHHIFFIHFWFLPFIQMDHRKTIYVQNEMLIISSQWIWLDIEKFKPLPLFKPMHQSISFMNQCSIINKPIRFKLRLLLIVFYWSNSKYNELLILRNRGYFVHLSKLTINSH
jgi:hypothetical protein